MQQLKERYLSAKRALFDAVYGRRLNPEQCRVVFTARGPVLVLAGAGSGKTTVLVNRIVYLIKYGDAYFSEHVPQNITEEGVRAMEMAASLEPSEIEELLCGFADAPVAPWSVLAITFTNKAAGEIKDRLAKSFDDPTVSSSVWAGTFHSVCVRILRKYGDRLGYRDGFSIYDTDDKKRLITLCMKELGIDEKRLSPRAVADAISREKDELRGPDEAEAGSDPRMRDVATIYRLYNKRLMEYNAVDFDDIIMKTVELLSTDEEVRTYYQSKFRYVLVDEYQDTNYAQFVLTRLLSDKYRNIMVVGDDDQSIYRFRGATVENILNFDKTYPDSTVVKLEQNYRSTSTILEAANSVISNNARRHGKRLWCKKGEGEKITLRQAPDQNAEGGYVLDRIAHGVAKEGRRYCDFAVLYRINALGRTLQTAFAKSGVPYKVIGDMRFYDRKEIKDMLAYLTVAVSPSDQLRLKRIINEPRRKIGDATVAAVEEIATAEGCSAYEIMGRADGYTALQRSAVKLMGFHRMIEGVRSEYSLPSAMIGALFERSGYREMLAAEGFEGEGKIENVEELVSAAAEYEARCRESESEPTAAGFLEEISLISDVDKYDESADAVVLMTVHAAKGLEFPVVFLVGMEDGIFPSAQCIGEADETDEERRLAYVAITRAKEKLYITYARERMMYGKTTYGTLSRFVREEIPTSLLDREMPRGQSRTASYAAYGAQSRYGSGRAEPTANRLSEFRRPPEITNQKRKSGAAEYGIERLSPGTAVTHGLFGDGEIVSARDMGGDVLYEVRFESGQTKKLMATFAKLKRR